MPFKIGDEAELLISSYEFDLYAGSVVEIHNIIYDSNNNPLVIGVFVLVDDEWVVRNIYVDHIRFPK